MMRTKFHKQLLYCEINKLPLFIYQDMKCLYCRADLEAQYTDVQFETELITTCKACKKSFCT